MKRTVITILTALLPAIATGQESADDVARQLANPNAPLATLNFKLQYRAFDGDLEDADRDGRQELSALGHVDVRESARELLIGAVLRGIGTAREKTDCRSER